MKQINATIRGIKRIEKNDNKYLVLYVSSSSEGIIGEKTEELFLSGKKLTDDFYNSVSCGSTISYKRYSFAPNNERKTRKIYDKDFEILD